MTTSLLEQEPGLPPHIMEDIATIRRNVELEARLIDDLLDLTRIASGKLRFDFQEADLNLVIRDAVQTACQDPARPAAKLELDLQARHHRLRGDPTRLQQVIWNLLANARKFTPLDGTITVRARNTGDGSFILVEVIDTGIGIEPDLLPRIFSPFEQGEAGKARRFGGLGLGLAISRAIVEAHGGIIHASSPGRGQGATFTIQLPCHPLADPQAPLIQHPGQIPPATPGLRILLVEDQPDTATLLTRLLQQAGHHVRTADCAAGALHEAKQNAFDLVISDLGLPDGDGWELMRELGNRHGLKGIAVSGFGTDEDRRRSQQVGFVAHLVKPIHAFELHAAILRFTSHSNGF